MRRFCRLALALAVPAVPAQAAIGGARAGVELDRSHFAARIASATIGDVHVTTLQPANGGTIREYGSADGTIFAVTWHGPGRPDLRQLLGERYAAMSKEMGARRGRRTARAMRIDRAELVVRSTGRPGAFSGIAYDPRLVPPGFAIDDLQ